MDTTPATVRDRVLASRDEITQLAAARGLYNVSLFGSVARGEDGPSSDIDLVVVPSPATSLNDLDGFASDVEDLLATGHPVDVASIRSVRGTLEDLERL